MIAALDLPTRPGTHRLPCPECARGRRGDALAVTVQADGSAVWLCHRCQATGGRRGETSTSTPGTPRPKPTPAPARDSRPYIGKVLSEARPAHGSPIETYLATRGLLLPDDAPLRFHGELWHAPSGRAWSAIVCPVATAHEW